MNKRELKELKKELLKAKLQLRFTEINGKLFDVAALTTSFITALVPFGLYGVGRVFITDKVVNKMYNNTEEIVMDSNGNEYVSTVNTKSGENTLKVYSDWSKTNEGYKRTCTEYSDDSIDEVKFKYIAEGQDPDVVIGEPDNVTYIISDVEPADKGYIWAKIYKVNNLDVKDIRNMYPNAGFIVSDVILVPASLFLGRLISDDIMDKLMRISLRKFGTYEKRNKVLSLKEKIKEKKEE